MLIPIRFKLTTNQKVKYIVLLHDPAQKVTEIVILSKIFYENLDGEIDIKNLYHFFTHIFKPKMLILDTDSILTI